MATTSVVDERRIRRILEEAVERFNSELLPDEERMLLLDRIRRLRKKLEAVIRGLVVGLAFAGPSCVVILSWPPF